MATDKAVDKDKDLAWAAGVIDGGGHIMVAKFGKYHRLRLQVCGLTPETTERLAQVLCGEGVPGYAYPSGRKRLRRRFVMQGHGAARVLTTLLPLLTNKRTQAQLGLSFHARCMVLRSRKKNEHGKNLWKIDRTTLRLREKYRRNLLSFNQGRVEAGVARKAVGLA